MLSARSTRKTNLLETQGSQQLVRLKLEIYKSINNNIQIDKAWMNKESINMQHLKYLSLNLRIAVRQFVVSLVILHC